MYNIFYKTKFKTSSSAMCTNNRCLEVILLSKEFAMIYYRTAQSKNEIPGKQRVNNE